MPVTVTNDSHNQWPQHTNCKHQLQESKTSRTTTITDNHIIIGCRSLSCHCCNAVVRQPWIQAAAAAFTVHCRDAVVWPSLASVWPSLASCTVAAATGLLPFVTCHFCLLLATLMLMLLSLLSSCWWKDQCVQGTGTMV